MVLLLYKCDTCRQMATAGLRVIRDQDIAALEVALPIIQLVLHAVCHGTKMNRYGGCCRSVSLVVLPIW